MAVKREDIKIPYHSVMIEHNESFVLNGEVYTSLAEIYNDGYNNGYNKGKVGAVEDFRNINDKYKEGFNDGYKKGRQECTESFNAGYDIGYRAGKEI